MKYMNHEEKELCRSLGCVKYELGHGEIQAVSAEQPLLSSTRGKLNVLVR